MRLLRLFGNKTKPVWAAACHTAYTDKKGRKYYAYQDETDMGVFRYGEMEKCFLELRYGMDYADIANAMQKAINQSSKKGQMTPDFTQISFLAQEIIDRKNMLIIPDILFNICATTLIREDENPYVIDQEILQQKVSTFKAEIQQGGLHAFFHANGWLKLIGLPGISLNGFLQLMTDSVTGLKYRSRIMEALISGEA